MRYRKLDADGDMTFGQSELNFFINDVDGVAQSVMTRLRLWVGEWFLDLSEGTQYSQAMLGKDKKQTIEPSLRLRILETPGVTSIETFEIIFDSENRKVTILSTINTEYGQTTVSGII